jgi:hypothetical protein
VLEIVLRKAHLSFYEWVFPMFGPSLSW